MASWGKHIVSGVKLVIQCFLSTALASVFIVDAAADTNTVIDGNSDTDADIGIFTNTNIVTIRPTEKLHASSLCWYAPCNQIRLFRYAPTGIWSQFLIHVQIRMLIETYLGQIQRLMVHAGIQASAV